MKQSQIHVTSHLWCVKSKHGEVGLPVIAGEVWKQVPRIQMWSAATLRDQFKQAEGAASVYSEVIGWMDGH